MDVLMLGWEYPPAVVGGLGTATAFLVDGLRARRCRVHLVVPWQDVRAAGVASGPSRTDRVHRYAAQIRLDPYAHERLAATPRPPEPVSYAADLYGVDVFRDVEAFGAFAMEVSASLHFDVIHAHDWMTFAAAETIRLHSGKPLVVSVHATERDRAGGAGSARIAAAELSGLAAADAVLVNSQVMALHVSSHYGVSLHKIHVVPWGIEAATGAHRFGSEQPFVLFLGRLAWQKGPDLFLAMAERVHALLPRAQFIVAGTGPLLGEMLETVALNGLEDVVHFAGEVDAAQRDELLKRATVCVMTSRREPFGLVALESVAAGTAVVIPPYAGVGEVLTSRLFADPEDLDELVDKVVAVLRYPILRRTLRLRGHDELRASRFTAKATAQGVLRVYQSVLDGR